VCQDALIDGFKFCLDIKNNGDLPSDLALPWALKCLTTSWSTLKNEENIEKCLMISTCLVMGDFTLIMFHEVVS
jgi:hypothetical protein